MENEDDPPAKVEDLENFPFATFQEFRKAYLEGVAGPGVDRAVAFNWARGGIHAPKSLEIKVIALSTLIFLSPLG